MLNEMFLERASKFAIFSASENTQDFFKNFIWYNFTYLLKNALVYFGIEQGIYKVKRKLAQNE